MKLLLGFYIPDAGTISSGSSKWKPQSIRRQTAWLPQDLNLGNGLVNEVMTKPFEFAANESTKHSPRQQAEILQELGLEREILNKQFRDLSTGQRQRIGLAICHLLDKPLLLLDEPTSALDSASKQKAAKVLLSSSSNDRTIISTSHDPFWVDLADNIIELD
jgi:ABC-type multidrug transport system ATPase subunit